MKRAIFLLPTAALALAVTPILVRAQAQPAAPVAPAPAGDKAKGYDTYMRYGCFQCHGTVGQGAATRFGPRLAPGPIPYVAFDRQIRNPRNAIQTYTPMPVYTQKVLTDQQVADMYAYLASIPPARKLQDIPLLKP